MNSLEIHNNTSVFKINLGRNFSKKYYLPHTVRKYVCGLLKIKAM